MECIVLCEQQKGEFGGFGTRRIQLQTHKAWHGTAETISKGGDLDGSSCRANNDNNENNKNSKNNKNNSNFDNDNLGGSSCRVKSSQASTAAVRPAESCVVSQYNCAPPVKPHKKKHSSTAIAAAAGAAAAAAAAAELTAFSASSKITPTFMVIVSATLKPMPASNNSSNSNTGHDNFKSEWLVVQLPATAGGLGVRCW
jgi:hypothetical protein